MARPITTQFIIEGKNNARPAFKQAEKDADSLFQRVDKLAGGIRAAFTAGIAAEGVRAFSQAADQMKQLDAQLKLATGNQKEFNTAQQELFALAQKTQTPVASLVTLYGRIARPLREAGKSQEEILALTEAVSTAFRISGASADEAENGIIQFAQALGAGALRGDEFNSVNEQGPRLMRALADSLGVSIGALREMAGQGQLTADVVANGLIKQLPKLREEAALLPDTVGGAFTKLNNSLGQLAGGADNATGFTDVLIGRINLLGKAVETSAGAFKAFNQGGLDGLSGFMEGLTKDAKITAVDSLLSQLKGAQAELARDGELGLANRLLFGDQGAEYFAGQVELFERHLERLRKAGEKSVSEADKIGAARVAQEASYRTGLRKVRDGVVADADKALKAELQAEKNALSELEKIRKSREEIQKRYSEAITSFGSSDPAQASYGAANALKVKAQQSLRSGDIESAQQQAGAALKMLQDLAEAGASTYGFEGFAKELQAVELAANDIAQSEVDEKLAGIRESLEQLKQQADAIRNVNITINLSDEEVAKVTAQMQQLAQQLGQTLIIPARIQPTAEMGAMGLQTDQQVSFPGYAVGTHSAAPGIAWVGERGPELMGFNGGERVLTALASAGVRDTLAGLHVGGSDLGAAETAAASVPDNPLANWGKATLIGPGGSQVEALVSADGFDSLLNWRARQFGTRRRG